MAELLKQPLDEAQLPCSTRRWPPSDAALKESLERMRATILVASPDKGSASPPSPRSRAAARARWQPAAGASCPEFAGCETDAEVRAALGSALDAVRSLLAWGERIGVIFTGISLGSILLLAALGPPSPTG